MPDLGKVTAPKELTIAELNTALNVARGLSDFFDTHVITGEYGKDLTVFEQTPSGIFKYLESFGISYDHAGKCFRCIPAAKEVK